LLKAGYTGLNAKGGQEAVRLAQGSHSPHRPATAIRKKEKSTGGHVPIIAMTASAMQGNRDRCLDAGMDEYVSKPITEKELMAAIQRTLPRSLSQSAGS
jgi:DNA-binding response OmpR family regulator